MVNSLGGRHVAAATVQEMERASVPRHRFGVRDDQLARDCGTAEQTAAISARSKVGFCSHLADGSPSRGCYAGPGRKWGAGMSGHPYPGGVIFREADPC